MKILFFIESLRAGGKERRIIELLKGLSKLPDVSLELALTRRDIHYAEIYQLGIPLHFVERKLIKKDPLVFFKFYRLAMMVQPDIIHVWGNMVAVYAVPTAMRLGVPLINNQITDATGQRPPGISFTFRHSTRIIANTKAGLDAYRAPMEKSSVIYNGFNFSRLQTLRPGDEVRTQFSITTPFVVGMVATLSKYKDYPTFIRAAERLLQYRKDVTFLCVGEGDPTTMRTLISPENTQRIIFTGKQSGVESIMNICDVGVLVSDVKYHAEGISNALLEFMALGKPVIATNAGGSPELVTRDTGFLVDAYDDEQLADRVTQLLDDTEMRTHMGRKAKLHVKDRFSIEKMIQAFYSEYQRVALHTNPLEKTPQRVPGF